MGSGAVPVAADRLRVEARDDPVPFAEPLEQIAGKEHVVRDVERIGVFAGNATVADLELPLPGHDLGVGAVEHDSRLQTGAGVGLYQLAAEGLIRPDAAVVGPLRRREAVGREAQRPSVPKQGVLLLEAHDGLLRRSRREHPAQPGPGVGCVGPSVLRHHLAEHEVAALAPQGIRHEVDGHEGEIRVTAVGLVG